MSVDIYCPCCEESFHKELMAVCRKNEYSTHWVCFRCSNIDEMYEKNQEYMPQWKNYMNKDLDSDWRCDYCENDLSNKSFKKEILLKEIFHEKVKNNEITNLTDFASFMAVNCSWMRDLMKKYRPGMDAEALSRFQEYIAFDRKKIYNTAKTQDINV